MRPVWWSSEADVAFQGLIDEKCPVFPFMFPFIHNRFFHDETNKWDVQGTENRMMNILQNIKKHLDLLVWFNMLSKHEALQNLGFDLYFLLYPAVPVPVCVPSAAGSRRQRVFDEQISGY